MNKKIMAAFLAGTILGAAAIGAAPAMAAETGGVKLAGAAAAEQKAPFTIAVLPVNDESGDLSSDGRRRLEQMLAAELHVPLNGYLNRIKICPAEEIKAAIAKLPPEAMPGRGREAFFRGLADQLGADMTIGLSVKYLYERTCMGWDGNIYIEAHAAASLDGWDRRQARPIRRAASRWNHDDMSLINGAEVLLFDAVDEILTAENLRSHFWKKEPQK